MSAPAWIGIVFVTAGSCLLIGRHLGACLTIKLFEERMAGRRYIPSCRRYDISSENKIGYWDNGHFISDDPQAVVKTLNINEG